MDGRFLIEPQALGPRPDGVVVDCRFNLAVPEEGAALWRQGHIPGALHLDLNHDLSGPVSEHGGRHPLPDPRVFAETLAKSGIGTSTPVIAYDDSRLAYASRLWWMMRSLGYRPPLLLNGGYRGWLSAGFTPESVEPVIKAVAVCEVDAFQGHCDIEGLRVAQASGSLLVDSREEGRYLGREELIDPVAGHIPGAVNHPWHGITTEDGRVRSVAELRAHWGDTLAADSLVVYCGSGVTACANLFSLALMGREDALLYGGSWSDWCSHL